MTDIESVWGDGTIVPVTVCFENKPTTDPVTKHMFYAKSVASFSFVLSMTFAHAASDVSTTRQVVNPAVTYTSRSQISFARAFIGGQDVVHITKADSLKVPFMDVRASDLLISYEYDAKGHLVDRVIWFDTNPKSSRPSGL